MVHWNPLRTAVYPHGILLLSFLTSQYSEVPRGGEATGRVWKGIVSKVEDYRRQERGTL
jgi:hypothetical protein